jgi:hypothetical protein
VAHDERDDRQPLASWLPRISMFGFFDQLAMARSTKSCSRSSIASLADRLA